ncbi:MAG: hypothetical protein ACE5JK_01365 [Candidatus Omnitrophota bacterium]
MKKVIALLVACMLLVGCTLAYAQQQEQSHMTRIGDAIKKFFTDLGNLLTKDIPETPQQKSSKHPYEPREKKGSK